MEYSVAFKSSYNYLLEQAEFIIMGLEDMPGWPFIMERSCVVKVKMLILNSF